MVFFLGRTIELSGPPDGTASEQPYDVFVSDGGDLFLAEGSQTGVTMLRGFDGTEGTPTFKANFGVTGESVSLVDMPEGFAAVFRRPGVDAFAPGTIVLEPLTESGDLTFEPVEIYSGRVTDPTAIATGQGALILFEDSGLGRGNEQAIFVDGAGEELARVDLDAVNASGAALLGNGTIAVAAQLVSDGWLRVFAADGTELVAETEIPGFDAITALNDGGFAIAREGAEPGDIVVQAYDTTGAERGPEIVVETGFLSTPERVGELAIGQAEDGLLMLAWAAESIAEDGFSRREDIAFASVTLFGEVVYGPELVDPGTVLDQARPDFTRLPDGDLLLSYFDAAFPADVEGVVIDGPARIREFGGADQTVRGSRDSDLLLMRGGDDVARAGRLNDTVIGGDGNDRIFGEIGHDRLDGGRGSDLLRGQGGNDLLLGGAQGDTLDGGASGDTLVGGDGNDRELGRGGDDLFYAGPGDDTLIGGKGADTFLYVEDGFGRDRIEGFRAGQDVLDFTAFEASDIQIRNVGDNVRLRLDRQDFVIVEGVTVAEIEDDILF